MPLEEGSWFLDAGFQRLPPPLQGEIFQVKPDASTGMMVLSGSSGRVDVARARLFASQGATVIALRWFGGEGQVPGICEVPLETFFSATAFLVGLGCKRIVLVGTSKGAEAALLTAVYDPRINAVVAISPSSVVWGNIGPGFDGISWPERSSWTLRGTPLPFVSSDPEWVREYRDGLVAYRGLFERCLDMHESEIDAAAIPLERTNAEILLVAGCDDALWPSDEFAASIVRRRAGFGLSTQLVLGEHAGHRILLPGETTPRSSLHAHGGSDEADTELGRLAWEHILTVL
ncbi:acyl-CoA thioesterase [Rhizobium laguerreae]|uniref:Acyl-CoA thioesterase n=1 Tax=Rhizobium laguerreae TaxID=1076926 RepID=A0AB35F8B4_9HYPH|nr:acyl-CoA thioesterase [Rhizobium laguerreae]MBY3076294.1 acyl-CoA thioesterase [Rhizobium laguerreae]MBY3111324.1 acyl-CoA thioesterase [Rhizobium laguerreae]MBY3241777.1 acyl-CoA thioesterase [Rhizobium laguerreae]MBY3302905.1 acyl-CoA thioesterase [Rhizobium laguerreae]